MTKTPTTRTHNPLPFGALEPHRFEDLVRQLAYGYRDWIMLEALGRSGDDDGKDIRGVERTSGGEVADEDEDRLGEPRGGTERVWHFQCKREKSIGPAAARAYAKEAVGSSGEPPAVLVLAAACNVSAKARTAFREEALAAGVASTLVWSGSELEDFLYDPANDHLLFAYFGISLQVRKRSQRTALRNQLTVKRQLIHHLQGLTVEGFKWNVSEVVVRSVEGSGYPSGEPSPTPPSWAQVKPVALLPKGLLLLSPHGLPAWWDEETGTYDIFEGLQGDSPWRLEQEEGYSDDERHYSNTSPGAARLGHEAPYHTLLREEHAGFRANQHATLVVPYDQILLVDEIGDHYNPRTHLTVEGDRLEVFRGRSDVLISDRHWSHQVAWGFDAPLDLVPLADLQRAQVLPREHLPAEPTEPRPRRRVPRMGMPPGDKPEVPTAE